MSGALFAFASVCLIACTTEPAEKPFCAGQLPFDAFDAGASNASETSTARLCDDGDPCTEDRCDPTLDRCIFVARNASLACLTDRHCDDGQACTDDTCVPDECGHLRCRNVSRQGCDTCGDGLGGECDDGNDCTIERCVDHACQVERQPHCEMLCGRAQFPGGRWFSDPELDAYMTTSGIAVFAQRSSEPCPTSEACACEGGLMVGSALIVGIAGEDDPSCTLDRCEGPAVTRCDVLHEGRTYAVWGRSAGSGSLALEGFCLTMGLGNLGGEWVGSLTFADGVVPLVAEGVYIPGDDTAGWGFAFELSCRDCDYALPSPVVAVVFSSQSLSLALPLIDASGTPRVLAGTVFPSGHALVGDLADGDFVAVLRMELQDPTTP